MNNPQVTPHHSPQKCVIHYL